MGISIRQDIIEMLERNLTDAEKWRELDRELVGYGRMSPAEIVGLIVPREAYAQMSVFEAAMACARGFDEEESPCRPVECRGGKWFLSDALQNRRSGHSEQCGGLSETGRQGRVTGVTTGAGRRNGQKPISDQVGGPDGVFVDGLYWEL